MRAELFPLIGVFLLGVGCAPQKIVTEEGLTDVMSQVSLGDPLEKLEGKLADLGFGKPETYTYAEYWEKFGQPVSRFDKSKAKPESIYSSYWWAQKTITGYGPRYAVEVHSINGKIIEILD